MSDSFASIARQRGKTVLLLVLPLTQPGWSSLHSVIPESVFWDVLEQLKAAGAEGILVVPIERMIL